MSQGDHCCVIERLRAGRSSGWPLPSIEDQVDAVGDQNGQGANVDKVCHRVG